MVQQVKGILPWRARLQLRGTSASDAGMEEAKRSTLYLSEFVGDNIALFSEEGYRTLLQIARLLYQRCYTRL